MLTLKQTTTSLLALLLLAGCGTTLAPAAKARTGALAARQAVTLDLLTYNTWGKPGILGTDLENRFTRIGPAIRPFGVVALQETFTRYAAPMGELSAFPFKHWQDNRGLFHLSCGLYTLSKHPIVKTDFAPFKQAGHFDRFAKKGVLFTRLRVEGLGEVDLYNTHYQAMQGYTRERIHDNTVLADLVKRHDKGNPTFLLGDFNMTPGTPEYQDLMARLSPRDTWAEAHPGDAGHTTTPANPHTPKGDAERLDYIFALPNDRFAIQVEDIRLAFDQPVDGTVMSDHYGVAGRFTVMPISPGREAPTPPGR